MPVGFNAENIIPLYIDGILHLINVEELETLISFPNENNSYLVKEDVSSLHFYSLGPNGLSQVKQISREIVEQSITLKTHNGREIRLGSDQQILVKTTNGTTFIKAKELKPGMVVGEFAGNILTNRIPPEIDIISEFMSESPPEIPARLYVTNTRNLLLTLGDALERILEREEIDKENEQFAPNRITLQQFYLLINKYGLMDYADDNLFITSKDGNGTVPLTLEITNQLFEFLGLFIRYGFFSKNDGHPFLIVPPDLVPKSLSLIRYLTNSPITYFETTNRMIEIHFGKEVEGWLLRYVFGINPYYNQRTFPRFTNICDKSDIIMFIKYFMEIDYSTGLVTHNSLRFPNKSMTQQAYYFLRSIGKDIKFMENNHSAYQKITVTDSTKYYNWDPIIEISKEKQKEYFYSIKNENNTPYYAGTGFILK